MKTENPHQSQTHPSFGVIEVGHVSGSRTRLFGSSAYGGNHVNITISLASLSRDPERHRSTIFPEKRLIELSLTPLQFAQLMTSMGSEGVPCSISFLDGKMIEEHEGPTTDAEHLQVEFAKEMQELGKGCDEILVAARKLKDKPNVNKGDRESFVSMAEGLVAKIVAAQPYIASRFAEFVEDVTAEIKAKI